MLVLLNLAATFSTNAAVPPPPQTPIMDQIEARVRLPRGAEPLPRYRRFYAFNRRDRGRVDAVYSLYERNPQSGRLWVRPDQLPLIDDGGCGVITFSYVIATQRFENIACNGEA